MRKLILLPLLLPLLSFGGQQLDSLLRVLKTAADDSNKVDLLYEISENCDENEILGYATRSYELGEKLHYRYGMANALNNMGYAYYHLGDIKRSLECYNQSLKLNEEIGNKTGIATCLNNIGYTYEEQSELDNALDNYRKSLAIRTELNDLSGMSIAINNIGVVFKMRNMPDSALPYYVRSLQLCRQVGDSISTATAYANIGHIYLQKRDTVTAMRYFNRNLDMLEQTGFKMGMAYALNNVGTIHYLQHNYEKAEELCRRSLEISRKLGLPKYVMNAALELSLICAAKKKFEEAYHMHLLYKKMQDSIYNRETQEVALKNKMQYEYEKKEAVAQAEQDKKDATQAIIRNSLLAGFALVLVLAFVIYRGYRSKQKANVEISSQKAIIEEKNKNITDSILYAKRIQDSLLPTEKYMDRNIKRLRKDG